MMKPIVKASVALGLTAALVTSVANSSFARDRWVGPAVGFGVGAAVGAAAANARANAYYNDPYYAHNPYAYDPYYGGRVYVEPAYRGPGAYYAPYRNCSAENAGRQDAGC